MPSLLRFWTQWKWFKKVDKTAQNGHFTVHIVSTGTWCYALFLVLILVLSVPRQSGVPRVTETGTKLQLKGMQRMSYITVQEAAEKWSVSERFIRRYCAQRRIPGLVQYDGIRQIPEDAERPAPKTREPSEAPPLLKALIKQRDGNVFYRNLSFCATPWESFGMVRVALVPALSADLPHPP